MAFGQLAIPSSWRSVLVATPFDRVNENLAKVWFEQVAFPRACRQAKADLAFVPYWGSPGWQPCRTAVTVHDLIPLCCRPIGAGCRNGCTHGW